MYCRGVRGATTVQENTAESILDATRELLQHLVEANQIHPEDVASILFTTTPDLNAAFPARAARDLGWNDVALMCAQELEIPDSLPRCIRVLIHWNTDRVNSQVKHVYLRGARALRPDKAI